MIPSFDLPSADPLGSFLTQEGRCVVTPERLDLERWRAPDPISAWVRGRPRLVFRWLNVLFAGGCAWQVIACWRADMPGFALLFAALAPLTVRAAVRRWNESFAPTIGRAATARVEASRGWLGLAGARVVVHFAEFGRPSRRDIRVSARSLGRALAALRAAGWPVVER